MLLILRIDSTASTHTYHGEILVLNVVVDSDPSRIVFLHVKWWTWTGAIENDRVPLLTVDRMVSCRADQDIVRT